MFISLYFVSIYSNNCLCMLNSFCFKGFVLLKPTQEPSLIAILLNLNSEKEMFYASHFYSMEALSIP